MPKFFAGIAIANLILVLGVAMLGFSAETTIQADRHVLLAAITLLVSCLTQVITFTYFTVTGKLIGQYVHLGGIGDDVMSEVSRIKRRASKYLAIIVATVIVSTATGAAHWRTGDWTLIHVIAGIALVVSHVGVL